MAEVPSLECKVSLLKCFEPAENYLDWEVGKVSFILTDRCEKTYPVCLSTGKVVCQHPANTLPTICINLSIDGLNGTT